MSFLRFLVKHLKTSDKVAYISVDDTSSVRLVYSQWVGRGCWFPEMDVFDDQLNSYSVDQLLITRTNALLCILLFRIYVVLLWSWGHRIMLRHCRPGRWSKDPNIKAHKIDRLAVPVSHFWSNLIPCIHLGLHCYTCNLPPNQSPLCHCCEYRNSLLRHRWCRFSFAILKASRSQKIQV